MYVCAGGYEDLMYILARIGDGALMNAALGMAQRYQDRGTTGGGADVDMASITAIAFAESLFLLKSTWDEGREDTGGLAICGLMYSRAHAYHPCIAECVQVKEAVKAIVRSGSTAALNYVVRRVSHRHVEGDASSVCMHVRALVIECFEAAMANSSSPFFGRVIRDFAFGPLREVLVRPGRSTALDIDVALEIERTMWTHHVKVDSPPKSTLSVLALVSEMWHPSVNFTIIMQRALVCSAKIGNGALVRALTERVQVESVTPTVLDQTMFKLLLRDDVDTVETLLKRFRLRACSLELFCDKSIAQGHVRTARVLRRLMSESMKTTGR